MPSYETSASGVDLSRKSILLDTNVLVRAFGGDDEGAAVLEILNDMDVEWIVPVPVIVEAWGLLVGSRKLWENGLHMLRWLITPGKAVLISHLRTEVPVVQDLVARLRVDYVDAAIWLLASDVSEKCAFSPNLHVATYDTRDYYKHLGRHELRLSLYDMNSDFPGDPFLDD